MDGPLYQGTQVFIRKSAGFSTVEAYKNIQFYEPVILKLLHYYVLCLDFKLVYSFSPMFISEFFNFLRCYCFSKFDICFMNECLN